MRRVGFLAVICLTSMAQAQGRSGTAGRGCSMPDTGKAWYTKQREWMDDSKKTWTNDSLRQGLIAAAERMEAALPEGERVPVASFVPVLGWSIAEIVVSKTPADSAAVAAVRSMGRGAPPVKSAIGGGGVRAVWLIAQRDSALERGMVRRMMEAGLEESMQPFVAILEDRARMRAGRPLLYGTVLQSSGSVLAPLRIEDSAHVDLRREGAWLPPLAQAICAANTYRR